MRDSFFIFEFYYRDEYTIDYFPCYFLIRKRFGVVKLKHVCDYAGVSNVGYSLHQIFESLDCVMADFVIGEEVQ